MLIGVHTDRGSRARLYYHCFGAAKNSLRRVSAVKIRTRRAISGLFYRELFTLKRNFGIKLD